MFAQTKQAPASAAAATVASSWPGESESPGNTGAIPTPASMPASTSALRIFNRFCGGGVPGSVFAQTVSSTVGMLKQTVVFALRESSARTSMSRMTMVPLVISPIGVLKSRNASRQRRVSR